MDGWIWAEISVDEEELIDTLHSQLIIQGIFQ